MHETRQIVSLSGRTFVLEKLPAAESLALLGELLFKGLPLTALGDEFAALFPGTILKSENTTFSTDDLIRVELRFLKSVSERLKGGDTPVVDSQGRFQVENLAYDLPLFAELLAKTAVFQYRDFFLALSGRLGLTPPEKGWFSPPDANT